MWTLRRFPLMWLLPALLPVVAFTMLPIVHVFWTSLHQVMVLFPGEPFVGLENYERIVSSDYFLGALKTSALFTLLATPLVVTAGVAIALFLQRRFRGRAVVRSIILLPWVLPGAISAVLWTWVFHPSYGILNAVLLELGLIDATVSFLADPTLAFASVLVAHVWTQIPFAVVLTMAALAGISRESLEAAEIDTKSAWKRFVHVVFPEIKAMVVVLLVYNALTAFTTYDLVYAMTGGGPGTATDHPARLPDLARELLDVRLRRRLRRGLRRRCDLRRDDRRDHQGAAIGPVRRAGRMRRLRAFWVYSVAALIVLFTGGPVLLALYGSLVPDSVLLSRDVSILDVGPNLETYRYVFTGELPASYRAGTANRAMISDAARQVPGSLWNSMRIALATSFLNIVVGAPAAFMFARFAFPGKKLVFMLLILSPLVPAIALVTPIYMSVQSLGLLGSAWAIILVHAAQTIPFTVLILSVFFRRLPAELFEAATLDHCSRFQSFVRVAVPLALPSIGATGLFAFMLSYSEYLFSMILSGDARARPVSVVMAALARNTDVSWSLVNTGIFIALVPTLAIVAIVWRYVVEGLLAGAVKG